MVLDRFAGRWSIVRVVHDECTGQEGTLAGTARFTPDGAGLTYDERGLLTFAGATRPASRALLLRPGSGGKVAALFTDGRPFYEFTLAEGAWSGAHPCGPDRYTVTGRFLDEDRYVETWHAVGPDTDFRLTTTHQRLP